jgi:hypothetical protein
MNRMQENSISDIRVKKSAKCKTLRKFTLVRKYDWSSCNHVKDYNRQVTHNAHLYENQDFNVLKITNLTFKTDI